MMKLTVIGNLGSDAELRKESGQPFVSMSIAHTERRKDQNGNETETTQWISATLNGDGGNLLPYLKKGTKVYAYGDCAPRLFHSEKDRMMKAGLNLFIRNIELIGAQPDAVPRDLYSMDGVAHRVGKYYYCETAKNEVLVDRSGHEYQVTPDGWVTPLVPDNNGAAAEGTNDNGAAIINNYDAVEKATGNDKEGDGDKKKARSNKKAKSDDGYQGF